MGDPLHRSTLIDEDDLFGPPIDDNEFVDVAQNRTLAHRPSGSAHQPDDEDDNEDEIRGPLIAYLDDDPFTSRRFRTRDPWGREITMDDAPADDHLPTRDRGAKQHEDKEPRFNIPMDHEKVLASFRFREINKYGLLREDSSQLTEDDMKAAGQDPCMRGQDGEGAHKKLQMALPGDIPPSVEEPSFAPNGWVDYDFSSIEMLLNVPELQNVVPIEIPVAPFPSPIGVGELPNGVFSETWTKICHWLLDFGTEVAASWWLAHLAYYFGQDHSYYAHVMSLIDGGLIPVQVLERGGVPVAFPRPALVEEFKRHREDREPVANTFWTPKVQGMDGFPQNYWHPREGDGEVDTKFDPIPVLQSIEIPKKMQFEREVQQEKLIWDGIPGHTFRLPPYRFHDMYRNDDETPEYAIPDIAIDIRRIPVKGALRDTTEDIYNPRYRSYRLKPSFTRIDTGQTLENGEHVYEEKIDWVAVADEVDPWGVPGGGPGRDYYSERRKDYEGRYQYFIVNNDVHERDIMVNRIKVPKGFVAGPLPAFAFIEAGGNVGFWHGVNGSTFDFQLARTYHNREVNTAVGADTDGSSDDYAPAPRKRRTRPIRRTYGRFGGQPRHLLPPPPSFNLAMRPKQDQSQNKDPFATKLQFGSGDRKENQNETATRHSADNFWTAAQTPPPNLAKIPIVHQNSRGLFETPGKKIAPLNHNAFSPTGLMKELSDISKKLKEVGAANKAQPSVEDGASGGSKKSGKGKGDGKKSTKRPLESPLESGAKRTDRKNSPVTAKKRGKKTKTKARRGSAPKGVGGGKGKPRQKSTDSGKAAKDLTAADLPVSLLPKRILEKSFQAINSIFFGSPAKKEEAVQAQKGSPKRKRGETNEQESPSKRPSPGARKENETATEEEAGEEEINDIARKFSVPSASQDPPSDSGEEETEDETEQEEDGAGEEKGGGGGGGEDEEDKGGKGEQKETREQRIMRRRAQ